MTVRVEGQCVHLEGRCRLEDAEPLLGYLSEGADYVVEMALATTMHTAVVQVLLAARPTVAGRPANAFLCRFLSPILENAASASSAGSVRL